MQKNKAKIIRIGSAAAVVVLVAVGSGIYITDANQKKLARSQEVNTANSTLTEELPNDLLATEKIKTLATKEAPDSDITGIELEREHGEYWYKVELANGKTLFFDAKTGEKVVRASSNERITNDTARSAIPSAVDTEVSFAEARQIALAQKPGSTVRKIEFETEHGKLIYSVRFTDDARIDVDSTTGKIVRSEPAKSDNNSGSSRGSNSGRDDSDRGALGGKDDDREDDTSRSGKREGF